MTKIKHKFTDGGEEAYIYKLKGFAYYPNSKTEIRDDFIYPETFKTGDILIYENYDDFYSINTKKLIKKKLHMNKENTHIFILKVKAL